MGFGSADGSGRQAQFNSPSGVAVTADGETVYIADTGNHKVRIAVLTPGTDAREPDNWTVSAIAGTGTAGNGMGPGNTATLNEPFGIAIEGDSVIPITERAGNRVRQII